MNNHGDECKQKGNTGNDHKQTKSPWKKTEKQKNVYLQYTI